MGLFSKLFGGRNDNEVDIFGVEETCPRCGSTMRGDGKRFECPECGVLFYENGEYVTPWERCSGNKGECENCGGSLDRGDYISPWEDGDNEYGYVICPYCRHKNVRYD